MNSKQNGRILSSIVSGIKSGITGALIGFLFNIVWGSLQEVKYTIASGFIIGFLIGSFDFLFSLSKLKKLPYSILFILRSIKYFLIIIITIYGVLIVYLKSNGMESDVLSDPIAYEQISQEYFLANLHTLYVVCIAMIASFLAQLKSFFGQGVLFNYMKGSYHKPSIEERIFMFLDLNDATTLAEKLGPNKYSALIRDFFSDLDNAFTHFKGHVFQYVGDEVVVIWHPKQGLKNSNCINSILMALDILEKKKKFYLNTYQSIPSFKAALHIGEVSITEIGVSKKEIAYHGDTINTTARICGSAHELRRKFLISKALYDRLPKEQGNEFEELGEHTFKGKNKKIIVYSLESAETQNELKI